MPKAMMCPFFHAEKRLELKCDAGGVRFASPDERRRFLACYCCSINGWMHCTLARIAEERPDKTPW